MNSELQKDVLDATALAIARGSENLSMLLGSQVEFGEPQMVEQPPVMGNPDEKRIVVTVSFTEGIEGETSLVFTDEEARYIVELMTAGMDFGGEDVLGDLGMSALSEAMNQFVAGIGRGLGELRGELVNISPPEVTIADAGDPALVPDTSDLILRWDGMIKDTRALLYWTLTPGLAEMLSGDRAPAPEPEPPAPAPVSAAPQAPATTPQTEDIAVTGPSDLGRLADVTLDVTVELGRSHIPVRELLALDEGGVIRLDHSVGEPVDLMVNGLRTARGEIVVVEGRLGLRVTELIS